MVISIEGCLGVGKTTLVRLCAELLHCQSIYEQAERNPFLAEFYHANAQERQRLAERVQSTFLYLQESQYRRALELAQHGALVLCDFHPLKSLVFGQILFPPEKQEALCQRYTALAIPPPDLLIYLKADEETILSRVRKRLDPYRDQIDLTYVVQVLGAYQTFLRTYQGAYLTIDNGHLDYVRTPQNLQTLLSQVQDYLR